MALLSRTFRARNRLEQPHLWLAAGDTIFFLAPSLTHPPTHPPFVASANHWRQTERRW